MEYSEAIVKLFDTFGVSIMNTPFLAMSVLNDYIANDLYAKRLVNVLFRIHPSIDLIDLFTKRSLVDARGEMNVAFASFKSFCTAKEYVDAINPISKYLKPEEFVTSQPARASALPSGAACATVVRAPRVKPSVVAQEPVKKAKRAPNPNRMPRTTLKNVDGLCFDVFAKSFDLMYGTSDTIQLFVDGVLTKFNHKPILIGGIGMFDLDFPGKEVTLMLPAHDYITMTVNGIANYCRVGTLKCPLGVQIADFKLKCKKIECFVNSKELNFDLDRCDVVINGKASKINGKVNRGDLNFSLDPVGVKRCDLNWETFNGDILGEVKNYKTSWKPIPPNSLHHFGVFGSARFNFNLTCKKGKIKLK